MENEKQMPAVESKAYRLAKSSFSKDQYGSSFNHVYNLCTH